MNQKEKLFFDKLKDIFIGAKINGNWIEFDEIDFSLIKPLTWW